MMVAVDVLLITGLWDTLVAHLRQWTSQFGTFI
jgi:hypothetical protein